MDKKTYVILKTSPRLGRKGKTVEMTPREAQYWVSSRVIEPADAKPASKSTGSKDKGKR